MFLYCEHCIIVKRELQDKIEGEKTMKKIYTSTRDRQQAFTSKEAIVQGIASDGGLFVYDELATLRLPLQDMMHMGYEDMAMVILQLLLPDFTTDEITSCIKDAYHTTFYHNEITPLHTAKDTHILELFHGPTCAFKDIGLRMLPQLMKTALKQHPNKRVMILTATSGDTGKAALEGFCDIPNMGITVFYPSDGVSHIQKQQMVTQRGHNTCVCAIQGNFDDAQSKVKKIFQDLALRQRLTQRNCMLSSANSINIGRLIPQIVYYVYAYKKMVEEHHIQYGEKINFCVPTGNYGNVLAGYYAKCMGLPVHKFIVASNANDVLYEFLQDGIYNRKRPFYKTNSPSMDILVSSNVERLLYYKSGKDVAYIKECMEELATMGRYQIRKDILQEIQADFWGGCCNDLQCTQAIKQLYEDTGYVMDPHTANAYKVMKEYEQVDSRYKSVLVATASPYKFAPCVYQAIHAQEDMDEFAYMDALNRISGVSIPTPLQNLKDMDIRHSDMVTIAEMSSYVEGKVKEILR